MVLSKWKRTKNVKKAIFFIDAIITMFFLIFLLYNVFSFLSIYKSYIEDVKVNYLAKRTFLLSYDYYARDIEKNDGDICIIRFLDDYKRVCHEVD
jgi:hypothetical protein